MVRDTLKKWNKNSNWDADLKHGEHHEKEFMKAINHPLAKIEIKAERDWWDKTGNILIEVARDDKPSGIMVTKSTTWVQTFTKGDKQYFSIIFKTKDLKKLVRKYKHNYKMVGDGCRNKGVLIPFKDIIYEISKVI
jgi:hypothetical protein